MTLHIYTTALIKSSIRYVMKLVHTRLSMTSCDHAPAKKLTPPILLMELTVNLVLTSYETISNTKLSTYASEVTLTQLSTKSTLSLSMKRVRRRSEEHTSELQSQSNL